VAGTRSRIGPKLAVQPYLGGFTVSQVIVVPASHFTQSTREQYVMTVNTMYCDISFIIIIIIIIIMRNFLKWPK